MDACIIAVAQPTQSFEFRSLASLECSVVNEGKVFELGAVS